MSQSHFMSSVRGHASPHMIRQLVFVGGITSVGTEITASRLVAPYFGTSTFIWANLIGITSTFLAIGYWMSGRLADRFPRPWILYVATAAAALSSILLPYLAQPILRISLDAFTGVDVGAIYGSLIGVLLLLAIPITLLGFVTPYAVRLLIQNVDEAGDISGGIYALSTIGSSVGSFLPVLVLIPWIGTARTFLVLGAMLLVPAMVGIWQQHSWGMRVPTMAASMIALLVPFLATPDTIRPAERGHIIYETESADNYIQVIEDDGARYLSLNDGHAFQSIYDPDELLTRGSWDYFMLGPLFTSTESPAELDSAMIIGPAGGTVSKQLTHAFGPVLIDGVEIDKEIVEVGRECFDMTEPNLNVIVEDGRYALRASDKRYEPIAVDAYRQPYIPFQLTSREFFKEVYDHLDDDGTLVVNAGRTAEDYRLVDVIGSTIRSVFPKVYLVDGEAYDNTMVIATRPPSSIETYLQAVENQPEGTILRTVGDRSIETGNIREVPEGRIIYTDDHAPVERLVDRIILDEATGSSTP
ncbi:MAG TPA: fused MFS/spermidine synthase [Thermomicrobiales bacterium]|nr:fused MFS/spermidine synthase [Thermomicrobiales bacterium]